MTTVQIALPDEVKDRISAMAEKQHITLEQFMTMALMEKLSTIPAPYLEQRAARGKREDFEAFLAQVPDVEPEERDKLP